MIEIQMRPDKRISVKTPFALKEICQSLPGRRWDPTEKHWHVPGTPAAACAVLAAFTGHPTAICDEVREIAERGAHADRLRERGTDLDAIPETKTTPWSNQLRGYHMIMEQDATFLAWEMGTGKSKPVVDAIANLGDATKTLILCPLSVVHVWPREFIRHAGLPVVVVPLFKGSVNDRMIQATRSIEKAGRKGMPIVLVINYEAAWRDPFKEFALTTPWDAVVADESHRVKAPGGTASKFLGMLGKYAAARGAKRICLTGTPMPHSPLDAYAQFRFLDPGIFGSSFVAFRSRYAVMGGYGNHQVLTFQRLDELHSKFYSIADRVTKTDILDLPPFVHEERFVEMGAKAKKIYDDLERHMVADIESGVVTASNALARLTRLQQVTSGFACVQTPDQARRFQPGTEIRVDDAKTKTLIDILNNELAPGQPVAVFCRFVKDLEAVHLAAEAAGRESVELSGKRNEIGDTWKDGPDTVAAVQIHSGGVGVDLTRANVAVYFSLSFDGGDYEQSLSRLHRMGQDRSVTYLHLIVQDAIDRYIYNALSRRAHVVKSVLADYIKSDKKTFV